MRFVLVFAAVLAGAVTPLAAQNAAPSFSKEIMPIFKTRCIACHMTGTEPGKMSLVPAKAYAMLVGAKSTESQLVRIQPAAPERSYLLHKLEGTHIKAGGSGMRMPLGGMPLPADKIAVIRRWVIAGAPDN